MKIYRRAGELPVDYAVTGGLRFGLKITFYNLRPTVPGNYSNTVLVIMGKAKD